MSALVREPPKSNSKTQPPSPRNSLGSFGEQKALVFLESLGYVFQTSNFRVPIGEIDLIFMDQDTLVFVEVKTRSQLNQGLPEEAVTKRKLATITRVGEWYIQKNHVGNLRARIDVIAIDTTTQPITLRHHKDVTG